MELKLVNAKKKVKLPDDIFACDFNEPLIHQVVTAYMAASRHGTKAQKTRAEVRGGGAKPWRQKGTGQARAGTIRSPLWRKGGVIFAAKPRNYKQKVNKKMYRAALRSIFSELIRQERLLVVDAFKVETPKTKDLLQKLKEMDVSDNVMIVSSEIEKNLYLAARNLPYVEVQDSVATTRDPVSLIRAEKIIITMAALKEVEGVLQ